VSALEWTPHDGVYRCGEYEARPAPNGWRLFLRGCFVFSAATSAEIRRFVAARKTLEIPK